MPGTTGEDYADLVLRRHRASEEGSKLGLVAAPQVGCLSTKPASHVGAKSNVGARGAAFATASTAFRGIDKRERLDGGEFGAVRGIAVDSFYLPVIRSSWVPGRGNKRLALVFESVGRRRAGEVDQKGVRQRTFRIEFGARRESDEVGRPRDRRVVGRFETGAGELDVDPIGGGRADKPGAVRGRGRLDWRWGSIRRLREEVQTDDHPNRQSEEARGETETQHELPSLLNDLPSGNLRNEYAGQGSDRSPRRSSDADDPERLSSRATNSRIVPRGRLPPTQSGPRERWSAQPRA